MVDTGVAERFLYAGRLLASKNGWDVSHVEDLEGMEIASDALTEGVSPQQFAERLRDQSIRNKMNAEARDKFLSGMDIGADSRRRSINAQTQGIFDRLNAALNRQVEYVKSSNLGRLGVGKEEFDIQEQIVALQKVYPEMRPPQAVKDFISRYYEVKATPPPDPTVANRGKNVYISFVLSCAKDNRPAEGDIDQKISSKYYTKDSGQPKEIRLSSIDLDKLSSLSQIALENPKARDEVAAFAANNSRIIVVNAAKWFTPIDFTKQLEELWGVMIEVGDDDNRVKVPALSQDTTQAQTAILEFLNGKTGDTARLTKVISMDMAFYESTYDPFKKMSDEMVGRELTTTQYLELHLKTFHDMALSQPLRYAKFLLREGMIDDKRFALIKESLGDVQTIENIE
jgi:hypothetical protein